MNDGYLQLPIAYARKYFVFLSRSLSRSISPNDHIDHLTTVQHNAEIYLQIVTARDTLHFNFFHINSYECF